MYLHLELKTMSTERLTEAVARLHYLHSLMSATPGFVEAQICEFLGNPGQYLVVRTWNDQSSHQAYRQSPQSKEFAASRPEHFIYDNLAVQEWLTVAEASGAATGDYIVRELHNVSNWDAYVAAQQKEDAAATGTGGVVSLRAYRMLAKDGADDTQALVLQRWQDRASYVASLEGAAPGELPPPALIECYQVVDEIRI